MMKRFLLLMLVLPIWAGCTKSDVSRSREFTHTGCASGLATRAGADEGVTSLLTLKYENGDLRVIRTNAAMNCSIKLNGMSCEAYVEGDVIHYKVYENDGPSANCNCRVEEMSSLVTGLQVGKEYTFDYYCSHQYTPFKFIFKEGLVKIVEEEPCIW